MWRAQPMFSTNARACETATIVPRNWRRASSITSSESKSRWLVGLVEQEELRAGRDEHGDQETRALARRERAQRPVHLLLVEEEVAEERPRLVLVADRLR